ncbi:PD-(D/E)XK nuclease-like domain-containing protein [Providencia alcalifaciens]|uniref:PD-(D/E)XK nuclease-like domain-containing protein n=1 Tax=Providencia alcalifaciens TaxID=126385 RepID=UPI0003E24C30|nr:PD-(D/E)XK nuclease-like domain-containing protein [Providencia alcalifaciens]ETS99929.1 exonuclease VIII domain protein [Providencia alcalifaciens PAL-3]EUD00966.1 exonuclease VIII domain protein [Providencia alcalifaciens PAL-1]
MSNQEHFEKRNLANIVSAILMANDINTADNLHALTDHLSKERISEEMQQFEKIAFDLSLSSMATPNFMQLHNNDIINAFVHVIKNPDQFRSNADRKQYFKSLLSSEPVNVSEQDKPDVVAHANKDKQIGNAEPEVNDECSLHLVPPYFEPGRYTNISNDDYHSSNGISSTMLKDGRISLMYFERRHISKVIQRERSEALDFGSLFHTLVLEPEKVEDEFSLAPTIPAGAFTNTDSIKAFIREYNADKPKAEQLKLTGKKEELAASVKAVKPDAVFEDDLISAWQADESRIRITGDQYRLGKAMQQAVFDHPEAGKLVTHPNRAVEVSYYGIDDDTGLDVRVRPDLEIQYDENLRVGFDLKSASLGRYKQDAITAMIRKEIINRDYHVSAAMYCDIAMLDQFFWIFVNKDENYHWVAIVEASPELLELGRLEYKKTLRDINNSMNTGVWPAPVTETLTINLTDFETRKLEELQLEA